jgi:adenine-specific DNA-methyltransferase
LGKDHTDYINRKSFLDSDDGVVPSSVFEKKRASAGTAFKALLGKGVFDFPKDVNVLARWIDLATQSDPEALVLDFFAGSGSTGHAVMDLNAADGGHRRYVMVQLDEPVPQAGKGAEDDGDEDDEADESAVTEVPGANYATIADITRERLRRAGAQIAARRTLDAQEVDTGFRSYRLAASNIRPWDGTPAQFDLEVAVNNLVPGRSNDDLLVEMMLRLGVDLTTPVQTREVAGSTLYNLGSTLFAYFGDITVARANEVAKGLAAWRDEEPGDADTTVVVRDTGFANSAAKLNLAAALSQAGFTTLRSI